MSQKARWKNYTQEEIQEIWYNSLTKKDFCTTLGYKSAGHVLDIQEYYSLKNEDLGKNNPNQKKYMTGPKGTKIEDLRGQNFEHWHVIDIDGEKTKNDYQHSWWICECDCENHTRRSIIMNNLKRGLTQSCGCQNTSILTESMIGKEFGKLTVLGINTQKHSKRGKILKCRCDCGNYIDVVSADLKGNHTSSCGCMTSKGEFLISKILKNMNIPFQQQKTFPDLIHPDTQYKLRFDFEIYIQNKSILLEYQGEQHYQNVPIFKGNLEYHLDRDNLKRKYCKENNIPLIEIPYWDFDKIDENYIKERLNEYIN